jgi:hypothetical protein
LIGSQQTARESLCARPMCHRLIPCQAGWCKQLSHRHCSWECYYDDAYDAAERDATAEGLTGDLWRRRASALFLERADKPRPKGRPRQESAGVGA